MFFEKYFYLKDVILTTQI